MASTALRPPEGGTALVLGCLTGESEERETWTAESLRTCVLQRKSAFTQAGFRAETRSDETSAVDVSGQHPCRESGRCKCDASRACAFTRTHRSGTSSNVVISREKFSSNLRV